MSKKIILNFIPLRQGGGVQNALSFVEGLQDKKGYIALVRDGSFLMKKCQSKDIEVVPVGNSLFARVLFELFLFRFKLPSESICFTLFGPPLIGARRFFYNISGCAYSNVFYPELDFWGFESPMKKRLRKIIDVYRVWGLKRSSEIILETDILYHRAGRSLGFKDKKLHVVRMTASRLVNLNKVEQPDVDYFQDKIGNGFNVLYLSGAHPNKRIHLLINVAKELLKKSVKLKFITTMPEDSRYYKSIAKSILENGLESYFVNLGSVEPSCVASLISSVDALINIALLESFSNNWVEAWAMEKPLIVTDSDWAKGSCGDAAVYVDPSNPSATAMSLEKLSSESNFRNALIEEGKKKLSACPTSEEKNQMYLDILSKVRQ